MSRAARLDAPGALHHVRARGIERRPIFADDVDREDFVERVAKLAIAGALEIYAWALMPNHVHLLLRTCGAPLERSMRSLLAGYATRFNRRHERAGHLFQNRYKSTLCEDESYFLTLVRYIHLNPVPSIVPDVGALGSYPFTGHGVLTGATSRPWQATAPVLARFHEVTREARSRYEEFVARGAGNRDDVEGGGLIRDDSGLRPVAHLRRGRERFRSDERVLGRPEFVERLVAELGAKPRVCTDSLEDVIVAVCRETGVSPDALAARSRARVVSRARRGIAYIWIVKLRGSGRALAMRLGLNPASIYEAARRGENEASRWSAAFSARGAKPDKP